MLADEALGATRARDRKIRLVRPSPTARGKSCPATRRTSNVRQEVCHARLAAPRTCRHGQAQPLNKGTGRGRRGRRGRELDDPTDPKPPRVSIRYHSFIVASFIRQILSRRSSEEWDNAPLKFRSFSRGTWKREKREIARENAKPRERNGT